jgi:hypothetical protein
MINIEPIKLLSGSHDDTGTTGQGCFMNVIAYLNGESQITDQSSCVCVTIRPIAIFLSDFANDEQRQRLLPFVLRAMGSATQDQEIMKSRIAAVVRFAEFNARLAAEYAAKSAAEYAKYAAKSAKYAAKSAEYAAKSAEYAAKSAESAEYAAKSAEYAAKSAKSAEYAAKSAARREAIFQAGLDYLEDVCPKAPEVNQEIIDRANKLMEMAC